MNDFNRLVGEGKYERQKDRDQSQHSFDDNFAETALFYSVEYLSP